MAINPYNFSNIESVSTSERRLHEILDSIIPKGEMRFNFLLSLEKVVQQSIRGGFTLHCKGYHLEDRNTWQARAGQNGVHVMLSALSTGSKMLLICDPVLVLALIDRLLGGELHEIPTARKLTEIETGVFSYLLMQLCRAFHEFQQSKAESNFAPIRVEKVFSDQDSFEAALAGVKRVATANLTVAIPELTGGVQIVLPDLFVEEVLASFIQTQEVELSEEDQLNRLYLMGDLKFHMRATVGETMLTPAEINDLQPGDIVLLDQPHSYLKDNRLEGDVVFYPVQRDVPTIVATIRDTGPPARFEIKEMYRDA
jgi:flagellar motor switch protein FliM